MKQTKYCIIYELDGRNYEVTIRAFSETECFEILDRDYCFENILSIDEIE